MAPIDRPTEPESLLAAVRSFVADDVLPNVAAWDREDVLPEASR